MKIKLIQSRSFVRMRVLFMIMRTFIFLLCTTVFGITMEKSFSQEKITIEADKVVSVDEVFDIIQNQIKYRFLYPDDLFANAPQVQLKKGEIGVDELLKQSLSKSAVEFELSRKNRIVIRERHTSAEPTAGFSQQQQQYEVTGTVTDQEGQPLPGANILEKGTSNGTQADFDGNFTISVKDPNAVLIISYIGFAAKEVSLIGQTNLSITLEESAAGLDEVVVLGFGTQKTKSVTGSVSTITPSDLKVPASNLTSALAGRVSGVIAYQRSGEPGADNAQFFVRGVTTFADGAVPLILIDGVELTSSDLSRLHPDDIESFSVLKDATTTAVYGARGANGIIYVTTKKGKEGKPKVSVRYETSINSNTQLPQFADPITYMRLANEAVRTRSRRAVGAQAPVVPYSEERISSTQLGVNGNVFPTTNWHEELLTDFAVSQRANFNVSGGGKVAQYYITAGYTSDGGILAQPDKNADNNVKLDRYLVRSNIGINLTENTKATIRLQSTLDRGSGPSVPGAGSPGANVFARAIQASPVRFPAIYDTDEANRFSLNTLYGNQPVTGIAGVPGGAFYVNPYAELVSGFSRSSSAFTLLQVELDQDLKNILPGLSMRFLGNNNRTSSFYNSRSSTPFWYNASETNYDRLNNTYTLSPLNPDGGDRALTFFPGERSVRNVIYGELALNYAQSFNKKHDITGLIVGIGREAVDGNASVLEESLPARNIGVSGRFTYGFNSRYYAEFGFGYNGSERFAEKRRFGFFPSYGLSWVVSEESFFNKFNDAINLLKVRASFGTVGNDAIGGSSDRFFYLSQVNARDNNKGYAFGTQFNVTSAGVSIGRYADPNILWEVAKKANIGFDLSMFNNAIVLKADYFTEHREDILTDRLVPFSLGLQAQSRANLGVAKASGFDSSLEVNKAFGNDFWISARGNFTYSKGRIVEVEEANYALNNAPDRSRVGAEIGQEFGYIAERLFVDEEDVRNAPLQTFGEVQAGDIKYKDINLDGTINDLDRVPIGKPTTPQVTYGMGLSLGYKGFDISAFFQGIAETSLHINPRTTSPFAINILDPNLAVPNQNIFPTTVGESPLLAAYANDFWSEDDRNPYALYPRLSQGSIVENNAQTSTWWLRDGSFLRLKQVEFGYTIRPGGNKNFGGMESLRFYLTGSNLLKWSKFKLWDPEVGGNGFGYPLQRTFNFGVLANF